MPNDMPVSDWLGFLDSEYLSTFIKDGGASVKFAVTDETLKPEVSRMISDLARRSGYIVVGLNAEDRRVHMPQDIFFGIAGQIDWRLLARRNVLRLAKARGHRVENVDPANCGHVYRAIGETNGLSPEFVLQELRPGLESDVSRNLQLSKDFRVAMVQLCLQEDTRDDQQYGGQPLIDWLTGTNTRVSSVRPFSIFNAINRTTARHLIESAVYWFHYVGYAGTVILLDNSRVTLARNPRDGSRFYTRPMAMDHYELLREFIDRTDRLLGTLMVIVTNSEFLNPEADRRSRGFGIYQALQTRIMDDVRDRTLANPIASVIRLT